MEAGVKKREWVKDAAIIFLAVLLVLTFFSNTIMNRSLPEVATAAVTNGSIVAKVRGTGTVTASGKTQVKAKETRTVRSVVVKVGQEVKAGDVLVVFGEGDETELEQARATLRELQTSYQRAAVTIPIFNYSSYERNITNAQATLERATRARVDAEVARAALASNPLAAAALANYENACVSADSLAQQYAVLKQQKIAELESDIATLEYQYMDLSDEQRESLEGLRTELNLVYNDMADCYGISYSAVQSAYSARDTYYSEYTSIAGTVESDYESALYAEQDAQYALQAAYDELSYAQASNAQSMEAAYVELNSLSESISIQQEKIKSLAGEEENVVTAAAAGVISTIDCTVGDTVLKNDLLCTIEVPDLGYTLSFTVTNDQAQRLRVGDRATISNYYWGNSVTATLSSIHTDPKNPQSNKLLTFDLQGDVTAGAELTISVGQKSANYDLIVPNAAIKSDSNGSFVLAVAVKSSPLGNRYSARRDSVEVLANDDNNSAVVADLSNGDYVITTSSAPVAGGDMVRMADNT